MLCHWCWGRRGMKNAVGIQQSPQKTVSWAGRRRWTLGNGWEEKKRKQMYVAGNLPGRESGGASPWLSSGSGRDRPDPRTCWRRARSNRSRWPSPPRARIASRLTARAVRPMCTCASTRKKASEERNQRQKDGEPTPPRTQHSRVQITAREVKRSQEASRDGNFFQRAGTRGTRMSVPHLRLP